MISELAVIMLACARIGAIHSIVFGGFSAQSVKDRIDDSDCTVLVVADEVRRSGKARPMKKNLEGIIETCPSIEHVAVVKVTGGEVWKYDKDVDFKTHLNPNSLEILSFFVEPSLAAATPGSRCQFERLGYFCVDPVESSGKALVFNRTVTLRDTWAKIQKKQQKK